MHPNSESKYVSMQLSLNSSSFESIQEQNHFQATSKHSMSAPIAAKIRFQNLMILKSSEKRSGSLAPEDKPSSGLMMTGASQRVTALFNTKWAQLAAVYSSQSCSVDPSPSNMHTLKQKQGFFLPFAIPLT